MKFIVLEVQKFANGSISTPAYAYDTKQSADAKYHSILAAAAVSTLPVHTCVMLTEEGMFIKSECFTHEQEPEESEE